jgi:hypothetical protein
MLHNSSDIRDPDLRESVRFEHAADSLKDYGDFMGEEVLQIVGGVRRVILIRRKRNQLPRVEQDIGLEAGVHVQPLMTPSLVMGGE